MIYVVAAIEVKPGKRAEFLALQRHLLPLVRAEQGCLEYVPSVEVSLSEPAKTPLRDNIVMMHEKWETLDSLRAHLVAPHMIDFRGKAQDLLVGVKVEVFESA